MSCSIIDFKCIIVNELVGSPVLTLVLAVIVYTILASRLNFGFQTTLVVGVVSLLILGLSIANFNTIMATITIMVGLLIGIIFQKVIKN